MNGVGVMVNQIKFNQSINEIEKKWKKWKKN